MDIRRNIAELRKQLAAAIREQRAGDVLAAASAKPDTVRGLEQRGRN